MGTKTRYVIAGNGAAAIAAAEAIRSVDRDGRICVVSAEPGPAYSRVLLHHVVAGEIEEGAMVIRDRAFYRRLDLDLLDGAVGEVDAVAQRVRLTDGRTIPYDRLLVATGARASRPPIPGIDHPRVHCLWTAADASAVSALAARGRSALVIGAGFVGIQAADALVARGARVVLVDVADRPLPLMLDPTGGALVAEQLTRRGVELRLSISAASVEAVRDGHASVALSDGSTVEADLVVVATGARPNSEVVAGSGVRVERGIVTDASMRSSVENVYAAGDVAISRDLVTGQPVNCAIWPVAVEQGTVAGLNMAGRSVSYGGSLRVNVTNALGLLVGSAGVSEEGGGTTSEARLDERRRNYRRLFFRGEALVGAMLVGDVSDLGILGSLIRQGAGLSAIRERSLVGALRYPRAYVGALGGRDTPYRLM